MSSLCYNKVELFMNLQTKNKRMRMGIILILLFSSVLIPVTVNDAYAKCMVGDYDCCGFPMVPPLKLQFQYFALPDITCPNQDHVLTERPNGKLACVTDKMAEKTGWHVHYKNVVDAKGEVLVSPGAVSWISFEITGATLDRMVYEDQILVASVTPNDEYGVLSIQLPSGSLPANFEYCNPTNENSFDTPFVMIIDGQKSILDEGTNSRGQAAVNIPLDENSETIEVVRTCNDLPKLSKISLTDEKDSIPILSEDDFDVPEVKLFLEKYPQAKIQSDRINESGFHFKQYVAQDSLPGGSVWLFLVKNIESGEMDNVLSCPPNQNHDRGYTVRGSDNITEYLQSYDCLKDSDVGKFGPTKYLERMEDVQDLENMRKSILELEFGDDDVITVLISDETYFGAMTSFEFTTIHVSSLVQAHDMLPETSMNDRMIAGSILSEIVKAGTYVTQNGDKEFWYTIGGIESQVITIELQNHEYDRITFVSENNKKWIEQINDIVLSGN